MNKRHPRFDSEKLDLTANTLRELLSYDPMAGTFTWRRTSLRPASWNGCYPGKPAGRIHPSYNRRTIGIRVSGKDRHYMATHLAWLWMTGEWPTDEVDHENTDKTDDRWGNLRLATSSQNKCNQGIRRDNTTGAKGVYYDKRRRWFDAYIKINGKRRFLGSFQKLEDAASAYASAAADTHGTFARIS